MTALLCKKWSLGLHVWEYMTKITSLLQMRWATLPSVHFTLSLCQCQSFQSIADEAETLFLLLNHTSTHVVCQNKAWLKHFLRRGTRKHFLNFKEWIVAPHHIKYCQNFWLHADTISAMKLWSQFFIPRSSYLINLPDWYNRPILEH